MTQDIQQAAETVYSKGLARAVLDNPFYAVLIMRRPMYWTTDIPTAAVDAAGNVFGNPNFFAELSPAEAQFVLIHEAMHIMMRHASRMKAYIPDLDGEKAHRWNVAADAVINGSITRDGKAGHMPKGVVSMPGIDDRTTVEAVYKNMPQNPKGKGGSGGASGDPGDDLIPGDASPGKKDLDGNEYGPGNPREMSAQEEAELDAELAADVAQAAASAKARGKLPGAVAALVKELLRVVTPWYEILEQYMAKIARDNYSWSRPNRRLVDQGIYLPSTENVRRMGTVVIGVDTSGSVSDRELAAFGGHIARIFEVCVPERVVVLYCDTRVCQVDDYNMEEDPFTKFEMNVKGRGGTMFSPVFEWVESNGVDPDTLVYFTDGEGDQGQLKDPGYPVVWLTSYQTEGFTFGDVIKYEV